MAEIYYTKILDELIRSDKLTPNEKVVLFVLLTYGDCEEIFISQKRLAKESSMSRKLVMSAVEGLRKKKYLSTTIKPDRSTLIYKLNTKLVVPKTDNVVTKSNKGCSQIGQGVVPKSDTSIKSISNKRLNIKKPINDIPYVEILDYLKLKAKLPKGFSATNGNKKHINARWLEGHRLVDFKAVIKKKSDEWLGTDMAKFLRPETLFGNKFESYLNQPIQQKKESLEDRQLKALQEAYPDD